MTRAQSAPRLSAAAIVALASVLSATACGDGRLRETPPLPSVRPAAFTPAQLNAVAGADAAFAHALSGQLARTDGNVVLSPASIATALQMAYAGARGATATEMARTLHLPDGIGPTTVAAAAARLLDELRPLATAKGSVVEIADAMWLAQGLELVPSFRKAMTLGFGASVHGADFAADPNGAANAINANVAAATHGRVRDLLPKGLDLSDVVLVLTNAVYLDADWAQPFDRAQTAPRPFTRADGTVVQASTMWAGRAVDYARTPDYTAVRLPYAGGRLAMTLLLPAARRPLAWPLTDPTFVPKPVSLQVPKFRFTWEARLDDTLATMGMPSAFGAGADFSGMATEALQIAFVQHKAYVAVDEKGTEAAAATAVGMGVVSALAPPPTAVAFDRPFLFRIDDRATGLPLFLGKVADPTLGG